MSVGRDDILYFDDPVITVRDHVVDVSSMTHKENPGLIYYLKDRIVSTKSL